MGLFTDNTAQLQYFQNDLNEGRKQRWKRSQKVLSLGLGLLVPKQDKKSGPSTTGKKPGKFQSTKVVKL